MYRQITTTTNETVKFLKSEILATLNEYMELIKYTESGIISLLEFNNEIPRNIMQDYLRRNKNIVSGVEWVYFSNNIKWNEPGGYFALNEEWIPDEDYDQTLRPWYIAAKEAKGEINFLEPFMDVTLGTLNIAMAKTAFDSTGRDIGVVSLEIIVDSLVKLLQGEGAKNMWLIEKDGLFITHSDLSSVMIENFFTEFELEEYKASVLSSKENYFIENKDIFLYVAPIPEAEWFLVSIVQKNEVFAEAYRLLILSGIITTTLLVVSAIILVILTKRIVKPLKNTVKTFIDISEDWDLTRRIDKNKTSGITEIYDIAESFNLTFDRICELLKTTHKEAESLSDIGNDLASNMNETAASMNEISSNVQSIKGRILNQSASVTETHATMQQLVININKLNSHVENQSSNISQASSAIEQMTANIQSVNKTLADNVSNVNELKEASDIGRSGLSEVAEDIQEIARESEDLLEINSVMENIASQTNLLSMNAAIEAAHAGEAGKGFAVVADEIRKLAENSSEQSKTIGNVLKKIKDSIDKITKSTKNVLNKFEAIDLSIKTVADQEDNIRRAMEEQGLGSRQILEGMSNVNEITQQVRNGSNEMHEGAQEVIRESENLEKATREITYGMNEMAVGTEHINAAVNHTNEISDKNRKAINVLFQEISRFKIK
jgi:methyl-accepting chemotaxis protein